MRIKLNFTKILGMCASHRTNECAYVLLQREKCAYVHFVPKYKVHTTDYKTQNPYFQKFQTLRESYG